MDKDDKKKMGDEKYSQYSRVKKIFAKKNQESRDLAKKIEAVLDNREPDNDKEDKDKRGRSKSPRSRSPRRRESSEDKREMEAQKRKEDRAWKEE